MPSRGAGRTWSCNMPSSAAACGEIRSVRVLSTWPSFTNIPPHSSSARRKRRTGGLAVDGSTSSLRPRPSDGPSPLRTAMRLISAYRCTRRPRRRRDRTGCGTDWRPVCARMTIPGRARNSSHTAAAMVPSSEKRKRLRAKPSVGGWASDAIQSDTTTPTTQPIVPEVSVAANDRRTPSTRPMSAPASSENANAGTSSQRSSPRRSNTEAARIVVIEDTESSGRSELHHHELAVGVLRAQHLLVELADARLGHLGDERPPFGELPLRHVRRQEVAEIRRVAVDALATDDARERPLVPAAIGHRDDRGLDDVGMRHEMTLELDRGDPLTARLDDVLRTVGDLHVPVGGHAGDVARAQPSVVELLRGRIAVVRAGDPRSPALDLPHRFAVPRQHGAVVVDDPQLPPWERSPGEPPPVHLLLRAERNAPRREGHRSDGAGLGHAPRLQHADAETLLERLHERARHGRTAAHDPLQRREVDVVVLGVAQQVGPD